MTNHVIFETRSCEQIFTRPFFVSKWQCSRLLCLLNLRTRIRLFPLCFRPPVLLINNCYWCSLNCNRCHFILSHWLTLLFKFNRPEKFCSMPSSMFSLWAMLYTRTAYLFWKCFVLQLLTSQNTKFAYGMLCTVLPKVVWNI